MNAHINITYRDKDGNVIVNPYEGQLAHSPETSQLYIYKDGGWELVQASGTNLQMTMYDMNKQIIGQLPALKNEAIDEAMEVIKNFMLETANTFYMLLGRDINYYTIFHCIEQVVGYDEVPAAAAEVIACVQDWGAIKSVDFNEHKDAIEIWFTKEDGETYVMYLFGYDGGVITCTL